MAGFTKLFSSIVTSTIWCESKEIKIVWITMLALADQRGVVEGTVPGLAAMARVTVSECRAALEVLAAPDPDSRTQDNEGRRISKTDGGWRLLNHAKYREKMNADERREYKRQWDEEHRPNKNRKSDTSPTNPDKSDTSRHMQSTEYRVQSTESSHHPQKEKCRNLSQPVVNVAQAEAEAEAEAEADLRVPPNPQVGGVGENANAWQERLPMARPVPIVAYTVECRVVLHYLNQRANTAYREVDDVLDVIQQRLNQGVTATDLKQMIDHQCGEWKGTSREKFLRPITLFGEKFDQYFGQRGKPIVKNIHGQDRKLNGAEKLQRELDKITSKL